MDDQGDQLENTSSAFSRLAAELSAAYMGAMAARLAYQIRTPLTTVHGHAVRQPFA